MRILIVSQWCDPEPTFKAVLFAKELKRQGHEVQILTGYPNYPGGTVYSGYKIKPFSREPLEGIEILRVALYPSHDQSTVKRMLNYASFMASSALFGSLLIRQPDVIYAYHPPLTTGIAAAIIKMFRKAPLVYDIQDLWPDTLGATGMMGQPKVLAAVEKVCQWVYKRADHLTVLSQGFKTLLESRNVPSEKLTVIPNWCNEDQIQLERRSTDGPTFGMQDRFNIVFAGTMGKAQALGAVLAAAVLLEVSHPQVQFVFVGGGIEVENLKKQSAGKDNVRFLPRMPTQEIGRVLGWADVLLVHLKDDPLFEITIPSKTQAYLAVGKPILMAVKGDAAELLERADAGVTALPENPSSIRDAVVQLLEMGRKALERKGQNGLEYYQNELSLAKGTAHFLELFEQLRRPRPLSLSKRLMDLGISSLCMVIFALPMAVIALLIRQKMGSPVIFAQERPGYLGKPFMMYKFRSMKDALDAHGNPLPDSERLTLLGEFLRSSSLDELPGLWNVLKGEMSFVGPRPLMMRYLERYSSLQNRRHEAKPGMTGWAQVNGRNAISWEEKFKLDVWYVDNWSLLLDIRTIWLTVLKVVARADVNAKDHATMPEFMGSLEASGKSLK